MLPPLSHPLVCLCLRASQTFEFLVHRGHMNDVIIIIDRGMCDIAASHKGLQYKPKILGMGEGGGGNVSACAMVLADY